MLVLPKFDDNMNQKRNDEYLKKGLEMYLGIKKLEADEYISLREEFLKGRYVTLELLEKSLYYLIEITASICAKYDIEDILNFDDALGFVIYKYYRANQDLSYMPKSFKEYLAYLNKVSYDTIYNKYRIRQHRFRKDIIMSPSQIANTIDHKYAESPNMEIFNEGNKEKIIKHLEKLGKEDAELLIKKYGLKTGKCMTYKEIGELYGMTKQAVEQRIKKILIKIKSEKLRDFRTVDSDIIELN